MEKDSPALCGEDNRQKRSSNFELLRILTMLCIIAHHYVVNSGITEKITQSNVLQWNSVFALIFGWGGKTGINVFVLITGYFMCKSKISLKKFLVLRCINNCELNSQWNPCICPTECMRSKVVLLNEASDTFLQLIYGCVALPF